MTLTRWKLLAGVFGIAVCGLAALAEPACRTVGHSDTAGPEAKPKGTADAKAKPSAPTPAPPAPEVAPVPLPVMELPVPATPLGGPVPELKPAVVEPKSALGVVTTPGEIPAPAPMPPPAALPLPTANPAVPAFTGPLVTPQQLEKQLVEPTTPAPVPLTPAPQPAPVPTKVDPVPQVAPVSLTPEASVAPAPATITSVSAAVTSDKKLKVTLQMDEGNPKFEVRDGEEMVLKVVSDKVDIASPKQKGERWSTLKACGQVKFVTPGGDGSCDELQVVPGTGEVIAVGHVKFTYNWGKVETSASAEKMNFRLGTQAVPAK